MINTLNHSSHFVTKLLLIGALVYAYKNREEIKDYLIQNPTVQEAKDSLKWAYNELRPLTEAEKAQHNAWALKQQKRAEDLKKEGVNPYIKYVTPEDKEWAETAEFCRKLKEDVMR